jgi:hypothetical protein
MKFPGFTRFGIKSNALTKYQTIFDIFSTAPVLDDGRMQILHYGVPIRDYLITCQKISLILYFI